jgi:hypothetical protein
MHLEKRIKSSNLSHVQESHHPIKCIGRQSIIMASQPYTLQLAINSSQLYVTYQLANQSLHFFLYAALTWMSIDEITISSTFGLHIYTILCYTHRLSCKFLIANIESDVMAYWWSTRLWPLEAGKPSLYKIAKYEYVTFLTKTLFTYRY